MIAVGSPVLIHGKPVGHVTSVDETGLKVGFVITDETAKLEFALEPTCLSIGDVHVVEPCS